MDPLVYVHGGFAVTLWVYSDNSATPPVSAKDYAKALAQLHAGMRTVDLASPRFTDRIADAERGWQRTRLCPRSSLVQIASCSAAALQTCVT